MDAAKDLLKRAVELDSAGKYSEALICYEEGIQNILRAMKGLKNELEKSECRKKAEEYLTRAEELKQVIKSQEGPMERVHLLHIKEGETGHSYSSVFDRCLDSNVEWVELQDPYLRARHQVHNLVRFCEVVVKRSRRLKEVKVTTSRDGGPESSPAQGMSELTENLKQHGVVLSIEYSSSLHDRQIRFSNGWIAKLGRGLDYFKKPQGTFVLGFHDHDLRPCHETTIEIFHQLNVKKIK